MQIFKTSIDGVLVVEPKVYKDSRGYFFESFSEKDFCEVIEPIIGVKIRFVQDNQSMSSYGVVRGLHFQNPPYTQSKLVRCTKGIVYDVAVDLRVNSPTYGEHFGIILSEFNHRQLFIPKGFGHGFSVLSENAILQYKCDEYYEPTSDDGISVASESLGIDWNLPSSDIILSEKDKNRISFSDFISPFN